MNHKIGYSRRKISVCSHIRSALRLLYIGIRSEVDFQTIVRIQKVEMKLCEAGVSYFILITALTTE